jgi:putative FHA domain protein
VVTEVSELAVLSSAITVHEGPALLLVDDAERVEDPDGVLSGLLASGPSHLRIAAAGRNDDVRTLYSHWTKTLRRSRCGILLRPNIDLDGDLLGVNVPRRASVPMTTGRGYLCLNGHAMLMQTALP